MMFMLLLPLGMEIWSKKMNEDLKNRVKDIHQRLGQMWRFL